MGLDKVVVFPNVLEKYGTILDVSLKILCGDKRYFFLIVELCSTFPPAITVIINVHLFVFAAKKLLEIFHTWYAIIFMYFKSLSTPEKDTVLIVFCIEKVANLCKDCFKL